MNNLRKDIEQAINSNSAENTSNTPDYILAEYLLNCLTAFNNAVLAREKFSCSEEKGKVTLQSNEPIEPPETPAAPVHSGPIPAPVGNKVTSGMRDLFAGTTWSN